MCGTYCLTASQVRDPAGQIVGVLQNFRSMALLRDMILGLKEVNEAVQREKDRVDDVLDSIADGIFTVDLNLIVRSFSGRMERLTGIPAAEAIGRPCRDVLHGSKCDTDCPLRWSFAHGAVVDRCHEHVHLPDNRLLPVTITTAFLHDASGTTTGLTGVVRDESELRASPARTARSPQPPQPRRPEPGDARAIGGDRDAGVDRRDGADHRRDGNRQGARGAGDPPRSLRRDRTFVSVELRGADREPARERAVRPRARRVHRRRQRQRRAGSRRPTGGTHLPRRDRRPRPGVQVEAAARPPGAGRSSASAAPETVRVDVRVIAATNRDLAAMVARGRFREDLYYRLNVVPIYCPPLRERREDIPLLVEYFLDELRAAAGRQSVRGVHPDAMALLRDHDWPGNVRELENDVERAVINSTTSNRIERVFLPASIRESQAAGGIEAIEGAPESETDRLERALVEHRWNTTTTAQALGISRTTLWRRMRRAGLLDRA